jgi:hypothetical protein
MARLWGLTLSQRCQRVDPAASDSGAQSGVLVLVQVELHNSQLRGLRLVCRLQ